MDILNKAKRFLSRDKGDVVVEQKEMTTEASWNTLLGLTSTSVNYSDRAAYRQVVWIYACVNAIAKNLISLPIKIRKKGVEGSELLDSHPLMMWFTSDKVTPLMNFTQVYEALLINKYLWGECFGIKEGVWQKGSLGELWALPPANFTEKIIGGELVKWEYTKDNGKMVVLPVEEVIFDRMFNPYNPIRGLSPVEVASLSARLDYSAGLTSNLFFKNGSVLPGVIKVKKNLTDPQFDRLRAQWEERHQGHDKSFNPMILEGGAEWDSMSSQRQSTVFPEIKSFSREEIAAVYRVPPSEIGIFEYANYANSSQQDLNFWVKTLVPEAVSQAKMFTNEIVEIYDSSLELYFDFSKVPVLQEDMKRKSEIANTFFNMGFSLEAINRRLHLGFTEADVMAADNAGPDTDTTTEEEPEEVTGTHLPAGAQLDLLSHQGADIKVPFVEMPFQEYHVVWYERRDTISIKRHLKNWTFDNDRTVCDVIDFDGTKLCTMFYMEEFTEKEVLQWAKEKGLPMTTATHVSSNAFNYMEEVSKEEEWEGELTEEDKKRLAEDTEGLAIWKKVDKEIRAQEDLVEIFILEMQNEVEVETLRNVRKYYSSNNLYSIGEATFDDEVADYKIREFFDTFYAEALTVSFAMIKEELGFKAKPHRLSRYKSLTDMMEANFDPYYSDAIASLQLRKFASLQGITPKSFGKEIKRFRAMRVARTETGIAMKTGRNAELLRRKLSRRWVSAKDAAVRDSHRKEDAQQTVLTSRTQVYPVTMLRFPQDPNGAAKEIINCRCVEIATIKKAKR